MQSKRIRWEAVGILALLLSFSSLGLMTHSKWQDLQKSDRLLNASLISKSVADYSSGQIVRKIAQVRPGVISEMIRDSQPDPIELKVRILSVNALINSPIPEYKPLSGTTKNEPDLILPVDLPFDIASTSMPMSITTSEPLIIQPTNPDPQETVVPKIDKTKPPKPEKPNQPENDKPNAPKNDNNSNHDKPKK